ncbi:hypothetical protein OB2597_04710 [Pseudooceanicola batsensis HTCC2597]|uniref:Uncharacterized protein n=1 Tax=Pseudooceanicola batsensis (strain ATCC BAA-863 / DSM 15984 / KCTC 12145 / HTCC2597) TaxID=252305 RepID=A3TSC7_PSEBH|nr:hypothetical protein [Pseudooceanicola batsensis]EAQ04554.1 hypothetical protein OB2597_04710 [Pseudooceanicola batsensis HTCC2597]
MADRNINENRTTGGSRSSGALAFIVGGLVVLVAALAYVVFSDGVLMGGGVPADTDVEINTTSDSAAGAEAVDDGAEAGATAETDNAEATSGAAATAEN